MSMQHVSAVVLVGAAVLGGCTEAFTSQVDVAARVGQHQLSVEQLARLVAGGKGLPVRRDVAEGIAVLWIDYSIFADHVVAGDSLTDSAYVDAAMWAEIQQELADQYHAKLMTDGVRLDSAQVDSAYQAGEYRYVKHILFRVEPGAAPAAREAKRRQAQQTLAGLRAGALTWSQAADANEDVGSRDGEGALGVIVYGDMVPAFADAAFALAPGAISDVTETGFGYHILWRPSLGEVREEFRTGVESRREATFDEAYLAELPGRWDLEVRQGIGPAVREMGVDPLRAKRSGKVLGTYRGGRFLMSDFARWMQGMSPTVRQQMAAAPDSMVELMVASLMRNEVLVREAREAGVSLTGEFRDEMADQLRRQLSLVAALIGFPRDTLPLLGGLPADALRDTVATRVLEYLEDVAVNGKRLQTVPPFLADTLRAESEWEIVPAGIERVLDRARQLRLEGDSAGTPAPPATSPDSPSAPAPDAR